MYNEKKGGSGYGYLIPQVESHVDDYRHVSTYTRQEIWNIEMDRLAKQALLHALETNTFITSPFPLSLFGHIMGLEKLVALR